MSAGLILRRQTGIQVRHLLRFSSTSAYTPLFMRRIAADLSPNYAQFMRVRSAVRFHYSERLFIVENHL
ncbi:hypothetical protein AAHK20_03615 [Trinickia sp. YCB016]